VFDFSQRVAKETKCFRQLTATPLTRKRSDECRDEIIRGSSIALSRAARGVRQRRRKNQLLVRLMDGNHSLRADADACLDDCVSENGIDILNIVHVPGYAWQALKVLCHNKAAQAVFT
jgi:hypothetical protein